MSHPTDPTVQPQQAPHPEAVETDLPDIEFLPADAPPPEGGTRCRSRSAVIRDYLE